MSTFTNPDPREARQPQWIRSTLFQLRQRLGEAERRIAELTDGPADSDTIAAPYSDHPVRLRRGESIEFRLSADLDEFIRARVMRDPSGKAVLDLNAGTSIA